MLSEPLIATVLVFAIIAFGEWLSIKTRARIPMLLTAMVGFLVLSWTGVFPDDILDKAQFPALGSILIGPAIVHMGTMIPFSLLKQQYKAVFVALGGMVVSAVLILTIVTLVFDYHTAVAGVGPLNGGLIALLITTDSLKEVGRASLVVIPALVVAFQGVLGMPLALNFIRRYARKVQRAIDKGMFTATDQAAAADETQTSEAKPEGPVRSSMTLKLFLVFVAAAIGVALGNITGIHYTLWCLAIGIIGLRLGILEEKSLEKANSFTITMIGVIFAVIGTMADVTPQEVLANLPAIITLLLLGTAGLSLGGYIVSKLVNWDPLKGMPVALTALFGFPGDYLLCEEASRSVARTKQEEHVIFNELLSPMLIGGFTTVTVVSVLIAGVLVNTL
ncbi:hypothetical protein GCM10028778_12230 [Barrientosiimonas marina]|uniref:Uncharacterized protein n=1 Tax=Lentibacillus kimchii TaxID=1542911 RepID=A0ABW2UV35_9BACI